MADTHTLPKRTEIPDVSCAFETHAAAAAPCSPDVACAPGRELSERVIGCIIGVHRALGPGFVEKIYRRALCIELHHHGLLVESELEVSVLYRGHVVGRHRIDLLVERQIILELKAVTALHSAHYAQLRSYLKAAGLHHGILVNFSTPRADFRRIEVP